MTEKKVPDTVPVYNLAEGLHGRQGGPYLDEVQAKQQEDRNAHVEGRKPNYDKISGAAGLNLVTAEELLRVHAGSVQVGEGVPEITAKVYGHIPNPVLEREAAEKDDLDAAVARAEANPFEDEEKK